VPLAKTGPFSPKFTSFARESSANTALVVMVRVPIRLSVIAPQAILSGAATAVWPTA